MTLSPKVQAIITAALEAGRLQRIAEGVRALPERLPSAPPLPIRPEACGAGRLLSKRPGLDAYDRARTT